MKKWKKRLAALLVLVMTIVQIPFTNITAEAAAMPDYKYELSGGNIRLTSYCGTTQDVVIPSSIDGQSVTGLGSACFANCTLKTIKIPGSIETIEDLAFAGIKGVTSITIPGSVKRIGVGAFANNTDLKEVILEEGVQILDNSVFEGDVALASITIPSSVKSIGEDCFRNCPGINIKTVHGSYGETYAKDNGLAITYIDKDPGRTVNVEIRTRASNEGYDKGGKITGDKTGTYKTGDVIHLNVEPDTGYYFSHWQAPGLDEADWFTKEQNYTIPDKYGDNLVIIATLGKGEPSKPNANSFKAVAGTGGKITSKESDIILEGGQIVVSAQADAGYHFKNWSAPKGSFTNPGYASTTFTMPGEAVVVTANFEADSAEPVKYPLTVTTDGHGKIKTAVSNVAEYKSEHEEYDVVSVHAVPDKGYVFDKWVCTSGSFSDSSRDITTFNMPGEEATVTAQFVKDTSADYTLTVEAGENGSIITGSSGTYKAGEKINLSAGADEGYEFDKWTCTDGSFLDASSSSTVFTMPAKDVTVRAELKKRTAAGKYRLQIRSIGPGKLIDNPSGYYNAGDAVRIKYLGDGNTNYMAAWTFTGEGRSGDVGSDENGAFFTMPEHDVEIVGIFNDSSKQNTNEFVIDPATGVIVYYYGFYPESITIPSKIDGIDVKGIGNDVFSQRRQLKHLIIEEGVTFIGDSAFHTCPALEDITFPASLERIERTAFIYASQLKSVTFPENSRLKKIGNSAFKGKNKLAAFSIPGTVTEIGPYAFGSTELTSITIPKSVTTIGFSAFEDCTNLSNIEFESGSSLKEIPFNILRYCSKITEIAIPDSVEKIAGGAFMRTSLQRVTWGANCRVASIEMEAFSNCPITQITIPASVTDAYGAFTYCANLEKVEFASGSKLKDTRSMFVKCTSLKGLTLPESVKEIGSLMFSGCSSLSSIDLTGIEKIGERAFYGCAALQNITLPVTVAELGRDCFENCTSLETCTVMNPAMVFPTYGIIPGNGRTKPLEMRGYPGSTAEEYVKREGNNSIHNSKGIKFVAMDSQGIFELKLTKGSEGYFVSPSKEGYYEAGTVVELAASPENGYMVDTWTSSGGGTFSNPNGATTTFVMPAENVTVNVSFKEYVEVPEFKFDKATGTILGRNTNSEYLRVPETIDGVTVKAIGSEAFMGDKVIKHVYLPKTLEKVGEKAFKNTQIETLEFTDARVNATNLKLTEIAAEAFMNCDKIKEVYCPHSIKTIKSSAFENCTGLQLFYIFGSGDWTKDSREIGSRAFFGCTSLSLFCVSYTSLSLGDSAFENCISMPALQVNRNNYSFSVSNIGKRAFANCSSLCYPITLQFADAVGDEAFIGCGKLPSVTLNESAAMGKYVFKDCTSLSAVSYTGDMSKIEEGTFEGCRGLEKIEFPKNLRIIGARAFADTGLKEFPAAETGSTVQIEEIGNSAFEGCSAMTAAVLKKGLKKIGDQAFKNTSIVSLKLPEGILTGTESFMGNTKLTELTFEGDGIILGSGALKDCTNLAKFEINVNNVQLGDNCFSGCTMLTEVTTFKKETIFGTDCLPNRSSLKLKGYSGSTAESFATGKQIQFIPFPETNFIYDYGTHTITGYKGEMPDRLEIPGSIDGSEVKEIGPQAFYGCKSTTVVIPNTVVTIGEEAFFLSYIENLIFEKNSKLETIGERAFVPDWPESGEPFAGIRALEIPASVKYIGNEAFFCNLLESLTFESGSQLTSIGTEAFSLSIYVINDPSYCPKRGFTSLRIPKSVSVIGSYAFSDNMLLTDLSFEQGGYANSLRIQKGAFSNTGVKEVVFTENVGAVEASMFADCKDLKKVTFLSAKTQINSIYGSSANEKEFYAFYGCENLIICGQQGSTAYQYTNSPFAKKHNHTFELLASGGSGTSTSNNSALPIFENGDETEETEIKLNQAQVLEALEKAKKEAGTGGSVTVTFDVSGSKAGPVKLTIPQESFDKIAGEIGSTIRITSADGELVFDHDTVLAIQSKNAGDIMISIEKTTADYLDETAKSLIGDKPLYRFEVHSGSTAIHELGGTVVVTVPYTLKDGEDAAQIVAYYIDKDGKLTEMSGGVYKDGKVSFTTNHFSDYTVTALPDSVYANRKLIIQILNSAKG